MFTGIIVIAIAHGILLTPAILGEATFIYYGIHKENDKNSVEKFSDNKGRNLTNDTNSFTNTNKNDTKKEYDFKLKRALHSCPRPLC